MTSRHVDYISSSFVNWTEWHDSAQRGLRKTRWQATLCASVCMIIFGLIAFGAYRSGQTINAMWTLMGITFIAGHLLTVWVTLGAIEDAVQRHYNRMEGKP